MCTGIARLDHQGLEQPPARCFGVPLAQCQKASASQTFIVVALPDQGRIEACVRLLQPQRLGRHSGLQAQQAGPPRREGHGLGQHFARGCKISALLQRPPQTTQSLGLLERSLGMRHACTVARQRLITTACQAIPVTVGQCKVAAVETTAARQGFVEHSAGRIRAVLCQQQLSAPRRKPGVPHALPGAFQALHRRLQLCIRCGEISQNQFHPRPCNTAGTQGQQALARLRPVAGIQVGPHRGKRRFQPVPLELGPAPHIHRVGHHPLHPLSRMNQ